MTLRTQRIPANLTVEGNLAANTMTLPASSVGDSQVKSDANVDADKLQSRNYALLQQDRGSAAATQRQTVHICRGTTGIIKEIATTLSVANVGDSTVDVDVLLNGTTVMGGGAIQFTSSDSALAIKTGTLTTTALAQGDVLEISITATVGTGTLGQGLLVQVKIDEDAS